MRSLAIGSEQMRNKKKGSKDARTVRDASRLANGAPWRLIGIREILTRPRREELVDGIIPNSGVTFLYGQSGLGKSFVVLDLALSPPMVEVP